MFDNLSQFGRKLSWRRQALNLSQEELAKRLGVSKVNLRLLEEGKVLSPELVNKVAKVLDIEVKVEVQICQKPDRDKLLFTMMAISEFAQYHQITRKAAAIYLVRYKGIDYLDEHYEVEHTFSFDDCVEDLTQVCHNHGGGLEYHGRKNRGISYGKDDV